MNINNVADVIEMNDTYGFSHLERSASQNVVQKHINTEHLKTDPNWYNPAAVDLMLVSYGVSNPYISEFIIDCPLNYESINKTQKRNLLNEYVVTGMDAVQRGDSKSAMTAFDSALRIDNLDVRVLVERAKLFNVVKDVTSAMRDLTQVLNHDPVNIEATRLMEQLSTAQSSSGVSASSVSGYKGVMDKLTASLALEQALAQLDKRARRSDGRKSSRVEQHHK